MNSEKERKEEDWQFCNVVLETNIKNSTDWLEEDQKLSAGINYTTMNIKSVDAHPETVILGHIIDAENDKLEKSTMLGLEEDVDLVYAGWMG